MSSRKDYLFLLVILMAFEGCQWNIVSHDTVFAAACENDKTTCNASSVFGFDVRWSRYRLIDESGNPQRLLKMHGNIKRSDYKQLQLFTRDGQWLDTEPIPTENRHGDDWPFGFWIPEKLLNEPLFKLKAVLWNDTIIEKEFRPGPVPPGDVWPLRLDRTNEWLEHHMLTRENLPAAADLADFTPDMQQYLHQHRLIYQRPAEFWGEGLILGNGVTGAIVTGRQKKSLTLYLDRCDIWPTLPDGRPIGRSYAGTLDLNYAINGDAFLQELDLYNAQVVTHDNDLNITCKILADRDLAAVDILWKGPIPIDMNLRLSRPAIPIPLDDPKYHPVMGGSASRAHGNWTQSDQVDPRIQAFLDNSPYTAPQVFIQNNIAGISHPLPNMAYAMTIAVSGTLPVWKDTSKPRLAQLESAITLSPNRPITILVAVTSDRDTRDPVAHSRSLIEQTLSQPTHAEQNHFQWWHNFWKRSFVEMPDKLMENQWYFGAYHQASFGRGLLAPSFFGLWHPLDWRSWLDHYAFDVQPPMLFWGAFATNHLELLLPYHNTYGRFLKEFIEHSPHGGLVPNNGYPDFAGDHIDLGGTSHRGATGQLALNFWHDYLYTQDRQLLEFITYPMLAAFADCYAGFLKCEADGLYHSYNSSCPEQQHTSFDNVHDRANIHACLSAAIQAANILHTDPDRVKKWQHVLDHLFPYPQDETSIGDATYNMHPYRCHASVMVPVYPCLTAEPGDLIWNKLSTAYDITTNLIGHNPLGRHETIPGHQGGIEPMAFNSAFLLPAAARIKGWHEFNRLYYAMVPRLQLKRNGQMSIADVRHSPKMTHMAIAEGVSGIMIGLTDTMIQNYPDHVRLFQAVPRDKVSRFAGLRAFGGFILAGEFAQGQTQQVTIHSLHGNTLNLLNPWPNQIPMITPDTPIKTVTLKDGKQALAITTQPNTTYHLSIAAKSDSLPPPVIEQRTAPREISIRDGADFDPMIVYFPTERLFAQFSRGDRVYLGMPREENSKPIPIDQARLEKYLKSPDWQKRQTAVRWLWNQNTPAAAKQLEHIAQTDPSSVVRLAAKGDRITQRLLHTVEK